jgi:hypothetical protein
MGAFFCDTVLRKPHKKGPPNWRPSETEQTVGLESQTFVFLFELGNATTLVQ